MSAASAAAPRPTREAPREAPGHIHLPSVHIRAENGIGFDYEEDLYIDEGQERVDRVIQLVVTEEGQITLVRGTFDELCPEELEHFEAHLPVLMDEDNPDARALMEERAREEFARQLRIAAGAEKACLRCGCSETRACSGGCIWASETLCSRCVAGAGR